MKQTNLVLNNKDLSSLQSYLDDKDYVAFDIETTGLDRNTSEIIGVSVCAEEHISYYVVLSKWNKELNKLEYLETNETIEAFLKSLLPKKLIMHNGIFDTSMVEARYSIKLIDSLFHDTMLSGHLLDENSKIGLKDRSEQIFGADSKIEQTQMKNSALSNGAKLTKKQYELYKADYELIGHYGAKDALLTLRLFYHDVTQLFEQGLDAFFYEQEVMPLCKGPTYDLNTVGLKVDTFKLTTLKSQLEAECAQLKAFIEAETLPYVKSKYPGTGKTNRFNIGSSKQLSWLLYEVLKLEFVGLTEEGKDLCKHLTFKTPYAPHTKRQFIELVRSHKGQTWQNSKFKVKKITDPWNYISCGKESLEKVKIRYKWAASLLEYSKSLKLLKTYVDGILSRITYGVINPSFKQAGTTSGRYSSSNPNFQNLPRKDKRIKNCIVARDGKVFVGADYSQLEPRVFASFSNDYRLLKCFEDGDDFYSVIGTEVFNKSDCSLKKDDENSFAKQYPSLRDISKVIGLSATYGTTAPKLAPALNKSIQEAQQILDDYFLKFDSVQEFMKSCHTQAVDKGVVYSLFGRPRRIPYATTIPEMYGNTEHSKLPYLARNSLNLAVNHTIQSTAASIMNRAAIKCKELCRQKEINNVLWKEVKIVMQVHDELILEGPANLADEMSKILKSSMENTVKLPKVALIADPVSGTNLSDLKIS